MVPQNILVADEDLDTRIILRALLERQGYRVIEANNATAAIAAFQSPVALALHSAARYAAAARSGSPRAVQAGYG